MPSRDQGRSYNTVDVLLAMKQSQRWFLIALALIVVSYLTLSCLSHRVTGVTAERATDSVWYEGNDSTGDIARDARNFLDTAKRKQQSAQTDAGSQAGITSPAISQPHPLLGKVAPSFFLQDEANQLHSLSALNEKGPVIVVFYYGYHCSHCVAQLFALNDEIQKFQELGGVVVAISPDSSPETARKFAQYGKFHFPCLADPDNSVAQKYGVYQPRDEKNDEIQKHGTFLVNRKGHVVWAFTGHQPFLDNDSLRRMLAEDVSLHATR